MYSTGNFSQRKLAELFNVSRRTIQFTLCPEKRVENYKLRVERGGEKLYYSKEKHKEYMKSHRQHKKELDKNNELIKKD